MWIFSWLASLSIMLHGSSMLHRVSVLHSFLLSNNFQFYQFSSVRSLSHVWLFATPWTAGHQASLSITNSWSLLKRMSIQFYRHTLFYSSIQPLMGIWIISTFWSLRIMLLWTFFLQVENVDFFAQTCFTSFGYLYRRGVSGSCSNCTLIFWEPATLLSVWVCGIANMSLSKLQELVMDREV